MNKLKKNNVLTFPANLTEGEREVEAIVFAAAEPLDVLLDLAKSQKVNLENISVSKLADQFHEFITKSKNLNLEIASDYLLMATWLTYLKSKLLLPDSDEEEFKVERGARCYHISNYFVPQDCSIKV